MWDNRKSMKIKKGLLCCFLALCFSFNLFAQELEPVKWEQTINKISETEFELIFNATIDDGWYMYSQVEAEGLGPLPTYFEYKDQEGNYKLIGATKEPDVKPKYDKVFELDVKKFEKEAEFKQRIELINGDFKVLEAYEKACDYFLFDTKGKLPGGNGYTFNWSILNNYPSKKPFFLSGGIGLNELNNIQNFRNSTASKYCFALDINSQFEIEPGLKDIEKLKIFKSQL